MWSCGLTSLRCALRSGMLVNSSGCVCCRASTAVQTGDVSSAHKNVKISIPNKIKRGPTDILEALKSTISDRHINPHYKYHDDPYLLPHSNIAKRVFALSKESGRKAAQWVREQYPPAFQSTAAQPHIHRLMPTLKVEAKDATVKQLKRCVGMADVAAATQIYHMLTSQGKSIDNDTKQDYLELHCFYNGQENTDDELYEEKWFRQSMSKESRKLWVDSNPAERLFQELEVKDARAYSAMICGLSKGEKAFNLYNAMREAKMSIDVTTYNSLVRSAAFARETSEARWQLVEQLLQEMVDDGVRPNLETMNAVLETITKLGSWRESKKLALQTLSEMKHLGIEPSLASYYFLLMTFCREKGPTSTILYDIMDLLRERELLIRDPKDINFFVLAMEICHVHVHDYRLAYEVDALLNFKNNYNLIGDAMKESVYYQHFFKILCAQENIHNVFEIYHKLVPNVYTPEPSVMVEMIKNVGLNEAVEFIPQLWSDIVLFELTSRSVIVEEMLQLVAQSQPKTPQEAERWIEIVWDLKSRVDNEKLKRTVAVQWSGQMLGNVIIVCLNCGDYEKACEVLKKCELEHLSISGMPSCEQLKEFGKAALDKRDGANGLLCAKYMVDVGYLDGIQLAKSLLQNAEMTDAIRSAVTELAAMDDGKQSN